MHLIAYSFIIYDVMSRLDWCRAVALYWCVSLSLWVCMCVCHKHNYHRTSSTLRLFKHTFPLTYTIEATLGYMSIIYRDRTLYTSLFTIKVSVHIFATYPLWFCRWCIPTLPSCLMLLFSRNTHGPRLECDGEKVHKHTQCFVALSVFVFCRMTLPWLWLSIHTRWGKNYHPIWKRCNFCK